MGTKKVFSRLMSLILVFCTLASALPFEASAASSTVFEDNFEGEVRYTNAAGVGIKELSGGNKVLEITDTDSNANSKAVFKIGEQSGEVTITYKLFVEPDQSDSVIAMTFGAEKEAGSGKLSTSSANEYLRFKVRGDTKLEVRGGDKNSGAVTSNVGAYEAGTWINIKIVANTVTKAFTAYMDDTELGNGTLSNTSGFAMDVIDNISFLTEKSFLAHVYIDDFTVSVGRDAESGKPDVPPASEKKPSDVLDFVADGWKVQLPVENPNKAGSVKEVTPSDLAKGYSDEYIYATVDETGTDAVVFHCPVNGYKTGNTTYARSELRELIDPTNSAVNWGWQGAHTLVAEECVTHVPATGKTITSQIHGIEKDGSNANPLVKVAYQYKAQDKTGSVIVELKDTTASTSADHAYIFPNVALGQKFKTEIQVFDGIVCVTISTTDDNGTERTETYRHDFVQADSKWKDTLYYFKLGNYIQDSKDTSSTAYADVWVYSSKITHEKTVTPIAVQSISIDNQNVSLRPGERTQLTVSTTPVNAYDRSVTWKIISGGEHAALDKNGVVTGIRDGRAIIQATSVSNPQATAQCTVNVISGATAESKQIIEMDFADDKGADPKNYSVTDGTVVVGSTAAGTEVAVRNGVVTLKDESTSDPAKLSFVFPNQSGTTTISFKIRIDKLGANKPGLSTPGRLYIVAAGSDSWYNQNENELYRMRNDAKGTPGNYSDLTYVLGASYEAIKLNADKVVGGYGDWVDVTLIVTPNDGTAKANTTDVYMNGYLVGAGLANRNTVSYVNRLDLQTGSSDVLTYSIDDVTVWSGSVPPEEKDIVTPTRMKIINVPSVMGIMDSADAAVEITPANGYAKVVWSVAEGDAIVVSNDGHITAVKAGTATLQAKSILEGCGVTATQTVTVQEKITPVTGLKTEENIYLELGDKRQLAVSVLPANASEKGLKYEVISGGNVIAVSSDGVVAANAVGTGAVRVTSLSDESVYANVKVAVTKSLQPGTIVLQDNLNADKLDNAHWKVDNAKDFTSTECVNGVLRITDANGAAMPKATLGFDAVCGKTSIQFKLKVGNQVTIQGGSVQDTEFKNIRIAFGSGTITTSANEAFTLRTNGTALTYNTSGGEYKALTGNYTLGEWNEVTLVTTINVDGPDSTDVYINGVKLLENAVNKVDYSVIDKMCFSADTSKFAVYDIDDILIWAGDYSDKPSGQGPDTPTNPPSSGGSSSGSDTDTTKPDNSTTTTVTKPDGTIINTNKAADGTKVEIVIKLSGETTARIDLPKDKESANVTIPAPAMTPGTVALIVHEDGTEEIVKMSAVGEDGMRLTVTGSANIKIIDNTKHFKDISNDDWFKDSVDFVSSRELFRGTSETTFAPEKSMTRSMLVTVLFRLDGEKNVNASSCFSDVTDGAWYSDAVAWANETGVARGDGIGFHPDKEIDRQSLCVMIYQYAKMIGLVDAAGKLDSYTDVDKVADWALEAVAWCVGSGIVVGKNGNVLDPHGSATRAEVAAILERLVKQSVFANQI